MSEICNYCGKTKEFMTYYNKMDGTGLHLICNECLESALKTQSRSIKLYKK